MIKQINRLLVVSVPKGATGLEVRRNRLVTPNQSIREASGWNVIVELPAGQWEIITKASEMQSNKTSNKDYLERVLQIQAASNDWPDTRSFNWFLSRHDLYITDTTDLLFLKQLDNGK